MTFTDGSTGSFSAVVMQTTDGQVYLLPEVPNNADNTLLMSQPIESISLNSINMASLNVTANHAGAGYALACDTLTGGSGDDTFI